MRMVKGFECVANVWISERFCRREMGQAYAARCGLKQLNRGQIRAAHQELIHTARGLAAFADSPNYEGLAAADVAGGEDSGGGGHVVLVDFDVAAAILFQSQLIDRA